MDLSAFKERVKKPSVTICTPSACGGPVLPNDEDDVNDPIEGVVVKEIKDSPEDDLFYALNLLSEAQDLLEGVVKVDKRHNVLGMTQYQDLTTLIQNIQEFVGQFQSFGSE